MLHIYFNVPLDDQSRPKMNDKVWLLWTNIRYISVIKYMTVQENVPAHCNTLSLFFHTCNWCLFYILAWRKADLSYAYTVSLQQSLAISGSRSLYCYKVNVAINVRHQLRFVTVTSMSQHATDCSWSSFQQFQNDGF